MLSFQLFMLSLCRQTDGQMDGQTMVKQYAPDLSILGHKKHDFCFQRNEKKK